MSSEKGVPVRLVRDVSEIVIGPPRLTKYEKARVVAARAMQLTMGAPPLIDVSKLNPKDSVIIAEHELNIGVLPILIKRELPNGEYQLIPLRILTDFEKRRRSRVDKVMVDIFCEISK
ncbi:MAG: DNA-directed RNA polymerase subunit K [Ignisphaera sp.]|uniref:DNA-directed RNA polymerase subunit Rpo6 n=1 Tax=Ignisphaera aggregans TaxID=334771 RepID=A0A7J3MXV9_9CREN